MKYLLGYPEKRTKEKPESFNKEMRDIAGTVIVGAVALSLVKKL
jgi:hypothetical protein